ncbi:GntR family transcriptional regulator [Chitinispirillales bacterium ANBcel5]|uniref:GntR family transcriptional regulator n=1 Tax=Cellulosispirillum alkaliphilum TaxID=3039283 RepID=UPI002A58DC9C|nr:GntR family transcriptional regulator [Chitinispirillales bacterium ANBcel5]
MKKKQSPATDKCISFIRELLSNSSEGRLPSVRELAQQCGVSVVTTLRATEYLRGEGLIEGKWGKGNFVSGLNKEVHFIPDPPKASAASKYHRTLDRLKKDLLKGTFRSNQPLPSQKQLATIYNVSYPTIRKVLSELVRERTLKQNGSRYYVFINNRNSKHRIALIGLSLDGNGIKIETERERKFHRLLSEIAVQNGIDIEIVGYNDYLDKPRFYLPRGHTLETYLKSRNVCGIILSSYHMGDSAACLSMLIGTQIPVSIWIEDQKVLQKSKAYSSFYKRLTFFDSSYSKLPGEDVGNYLFEKGHREIAYISPFHSGVWSQNRLQGLKKAALAFGPTHRVYPFVSDKYCDDYKYLEEATKEGNFEHEFCGEKIRHKLEPFIGTRFPRLKYELNCLLRDNLIFDGCKEFFRQAASNNQISAWVCANDLVACMVMEHWNFSGTPLEKRPALIGFDNTFRSLELQVSSYEFNTRGEVQSMINHLLDPHSTLFSGNVIRLHGLVIERASTSSPDLIQER